MFLIYFCRYFDKNYSENVKTIFFAAISTKMTVFCCDFVKNDHFRRSFIIINHNNNHEFNYNLI